ncbi:MAG: YiiD C-terminal domain-containing protein [Acidimicrobiia bacterium]|nr:YiiD C-terminal domain-containing protein [Acidimicrobiia bacterium]
MSDALSPKALTEFVHSLIPMARNAQIEVVEAEPGRVKMMAPLAPNTNHVGIMYAGPCSRWPSYPRRDRCWFVRQPAVLSDRAESRHFLPSTRHHRYHRGGHPRSR